MDAIKFERTQIHFLATFSLPSLLKVPYVFGSSTTFQRRREWICESGCQVSGRLHVFAGFFLPLNPSATTFYARSAFFPQSAVLILHFAPSLRFTLSLQSAFYTPSAFYPWSAVRGPQSAVRSPQSAVRSPQSAVHSLRSLQ